MSQNKTHTTHLEVSESISLEVYLSEEQHVFNINFSQKKLPLYHLNIFSYYFIQTFK